jgi:hypothetical protein
MAQIANRLIFQGHIEILSWRDAGTVIDLQATTIPDHDGPLPQSIFLCGFERRLERDIEPHRDLRCGVKASWYRERWFIERLFE